MGAFVGSWSLEGLPAAQAMGALGWALLAAAFLAAVLFLQGLYLLWSQRRAQRGGGQSPSSDGMPGTWPGGEPSGVSGGVSGALPTVRRGFEAPAFAPRASAQVPELAGSGSHPLLDKQAGLGRARLPGLAATLHRLLLQLRAPRRLKLIGEQLPDALDLMARALRAGHSFPVALQMVAEESSQPLASEFSQVHEQISLGRAPDHAFEDLARRVPSEDMRFFVVAVRLQRQTGGNLSEVLGNIARLIRSRLHLMAKVRVLSAEGRLSARVLTVMPLLTALAMNAVRPDLMQVLWTDPLGVRVVQGCAALWLVGVWWMWSVARIRV